MTNTLRIVTRKSLLALWQAEHVKSRLIDLYPSLNVTLIGVSTEGDKILDVPLAKVGGKGLFVKELEEALFRNEADIAVHSMKDVPSQLPSGLKIACMLERIDPRDAFISNHYDSLDALPPEAVVGTSSLRRQAQVLRVRPDLLVKPLRGNVDTRLNKLDQGEFEAIILAVAGLERLGFGHRIREIFHPNVMLPGIGQGALGIECREDDQRIIDLVAPLHHGETSLCLTAERSMNEALGGSCQSPIAGFARIQRMGQEKNRILLQLTGMVASPEGKRILLSEKKVEFDALEVTDSLGATDSFDALHSLHSFDSLDSLDSFDTSDLLRSAEALGKEVAEHLLRLGAAEIIKSCQFNS